MTNSSQYSKDQSHYKHIFFVDNSNGAVLGATIAISVGVNQWPAQLQHFSNLAVPNGYYVSWLTLIAIMLMWYLSKHQVIV